MSNSSRTPVREITEWPDTTVITYVAQGVRHQVRLGDQNEFIDPFEIKSASTESAQAWFEVVSQFECLRAHAEARGLGLHLWVWVDPFAQDYKRVEKPGQPPEEAVEEGVFVYGLVGATLHDIVDYGAGRYILPEARAVLTEVPAEEEGKCRQVYYDEDSDCPNGCWG